MRQAQRKKGRLSLSFYLEQHMQLAAQEKTSLKTADNTKKGLALILKKWERYFVFHWRLWLSSLTILSPRFCSKLSYNSEIFLTDTQVSDFKVFWKWMINHYNRISMGLSLKNYWRVLRMHALNKADWDFDSRKKRDICNVRCWFLQALRTSHWCLESASISIYLLMSMAFTLYPKRNRSSALTISTFFFIHTECLMTWHSRMNDSGFKLPPAYSQPPFSVVACVHCSILESRLTSLIAQTCPPTIQHLSVLKRAEKSWTMSKWTQAIT